MSADSGGDSMHSFSEPEETATPTQDTAAPTQTSVSQTVTQLQAAEKLLETDVAPSTTDAAFTTNTQLLKLSLQPSNEAQKTTTPTAAEMQNGFGGFNTAAPPVTTAAAAASKAAAKFKVGGDTSEDELAAQAVVASVSSDDFGDFDAAPADAAPAAPVTAMELAQPQPAGTAAAAAAADNGDDDFGDFDAAAAKLPVSAAAAPTAAAASQQPVHQQVTAAAVPEGPDILQMTGSDFLAAVLDAWQVLGAPQGYKAAAAKQPAQQNTQAQHPAVTATLPRVHKTADQHSPNSIMAYNGLPVKTVHRSSSDNSRGLDGAVSEVPQQLCCSTDLGWHGSASEARLMDGLGLRQAVERALAQMDKDAAGRSSGQQQQQQQHTLTRD